MASKKSSSETETRNIANLLMGTSIVAVLLSAVSYMVRDIWLASTQWLLVASVLALFAIYLKEK